MWTFRSALFLVLAAVVLVNCYPREYKAVSVQFLKILQKYIIYIFNFLILSVSGRPHKVTLKLTYCHRLSRGNDRLESWPGCDLSLLSSESLAVVQITVHGKVSLNNSALSKDEGSMFLCHCQPTNLHYHNPQHKSSH